LVDHVFDQFVDRGADLEPFGIILGKLVEQLRHHGGRTKIEYGVHVARQSLEWVLLRCVRGVCGRVCLLQSLQGDCASEATAITEPAVQRRDTYARSRRDVLERRLRPMLDEFVASSREQLLLVAARICSQPPRGVFAHRPVLVCLTLVL